MMNKFLLPLRQHLSTMLQIAFGLFFVGLGIYFIRHEREELAKMRDALTQADPVWIAVGILLLGAFVLVQGMMYRVSFAAIHERISLSTGVSLYLKRNLISVFLPAGVLTNMLFFNEDLEKKYGLNKTKIYFASSIFSTCSILSAVIVGLPALLWLFLKSSLNGELVLGIALTALALVGAIYAVVNIARKGKLYHYLERTFPSFARVLQQLSDQSFDRRKFWEVALLSVLIECIGIAHLYIAIAALGGTPTLEMAVIGYAIVLLLLMSSPFLRGMGAIEVALTYALTLFGLSSVLALSAAFLFRFFEFWSVLVLGVIALVSQRNNLLVRVLPAVLLFLLGLVNIISAVTPAMPSRLAVLREVIPLSAVHASTWLVLLAGLIMLVLAAFLLRGLRNAWIAALVLSGLSLIAHLTKGIDWEEAMLALIVLSSLLYQRRQYFVRTDFRLARQSFLPGIIAIAGVILLGTLGFYWLNPRHFNVNFSLWESFQEAVTTFFLMNVDLQPATAFGREFLFGMHLLGGLTLGFTALLFLRPLVQRPAQTEEQERQRAEALVEKYGKGSLDYFKTYYDKHYWFSPDGEGFVSFKLSRNYAIVLENPVCADDVALAVIIPAFDAYCRQNGLRSAYYRIPEANRIIYEKQGRKLLPIGEEAVVNLETFSLQGKEHAAMRNAVNRLTKQDFVFQVYEPPQSAAFIQQLRAVSEEWMKDMERSEIVFSQGLFDEKELKQQTILTLENAEGKVVGFVNLIPDYTPGEANFDLMRKTEDAPNGTMDFLFIKMFEHLKSIGFKGCNLGMVPMSGIDNPENLQERLMKLAYERIRQFGHYKSLRNFKEKFDPEWQMMYLVYDASFDLIYLPNALERVIQP